MTGEVLVFAESSGPTFRKAAFEAVTEGRRLADLLRVSEYALAIGNSLTDRVGELGKYGADKIILADDPSLGLFHPDYYRQIALDVIKRVSPSIILIAATSTGKDLAPRLAIHLDTAVASECTQLELEDGKLIATRPAYAGKVLLRVRVNSSPSIATLRPNVFTAKETAPGKKPTVEPVEFKRPNSPMVVKEFVSQGAKKLDLTEASVIISGGRGMGGPQNYKILEELAEVMGGVVGASRASVDAGWRPHSDQVGQTGRTVSPTLYIAAGISGAIQHRVGMINSKVIVAINKDPEAPIFGFADYGIVGDVFEVVPALTREMKVFYGKT
ncbi:electron transfer flavoprotein subunit alpha [archaeon 13_2_20CM_2_52_21]|nr:MAG: electron transfer flavoprotein subunit alpha [archaeon 13_2_20CM_2_52_21]OLD44379.1 MAG: electron transfer flavoprotein subunit alpha [archaeon 13_1_40CM_2_52_4]